MPKAKSQKLEISKFQKKNGKLEANWEMEA